MTKKKPDEIPQVKLPVKPTKADKDADKRRQEIQKQREAHLVKSVPPMGEKA